MTEPTAARQPTPIRRRWLWLAVLSAVVLLEFLVAASCHRSDEQLHALADTGTPQERVHAFHVLANRDRPLVTDPAFTQRALSSPVPLVRELAMTTNFRRMRPDTLQREHVASLPQGPERLRLEILLNARLGKPGRLNVERLQAFYASLED